MNRDDLAKRLMLDVGLNQVQARACIKSLEVVMTEALRTGGKVTWGGFGVLKLAVRKAKQGRDLVRGVPVAIPQRLTVKFLPFKKLKDTIN